MRGLLLPACLLAINREETPSLYVDLLLFFFFFFFFLCRPAGRRKRARELREMQSKEEVRMQASQQPLSGVWTSMPAVLNYARLVAVGLASVAAVAGFILVATVLAFLPFVVLGGLALIIMVVLIMSVSGFVSIGGTLYFLSRSDHHPHHQERTRISKDRTAFFARPEGTSLQVLRSCGTY